MELQTKLQHGISLIELMIGLAIGLVVSAAIVSLYLNSKHGFDINQSTIRIHENGKHALTIIKEDLRMAGFWGPNVDSTSIDTTKFDPVSLPSECDAGWATRVSQPVFALNGTNNGFTNCIPAADYQTGSDILTIRHASNQAIQDPADIKQRRLYLYASLTAGATFQADRDGELDLGIEAQIAERSVLDLHELVSNAYYIRPWSRSPEDNIPTLVREALNGSARTGVSAQPLVEFIEDLQISFGTDTDADNSIDRYENDASNIVDWNGVITVIVEVLARSPTSEAGYVNRHGYRLGDKEPYSPNDNIRRLVFRETVFLRNRNIHSI